MHTYTRDENKFIQRLLGANIDGTITIRNKSDMRGYLETDYADITTAFIQEKHNELLFLKTKLVVDGLYGVNTRRGLRDLMRAFDVKMPSRKNVEMQGIDMLAKALPLWNEDVHDKVISHFSEAIDLFDGDLSRVKLDTVEAMALFLGQSAHETGPDFDVIENLNYRCHKLSGPFRYYRLHPDEAYEDGKCRGHRANQIAIANKAYSYRLGNGGVSSGDGSRFMGAGIPQLTFELNYKGYHDWLKRTLPDVYEKSQGDKIMTHGAKIVSDSPHSVLSGFYYWINNGVYKAARYGATQQGSDYATRKINRYTDSYHERWVSTSQAYVLMTS